MTAESPPRIVLCYGLLAAFIYDSLWLSSRHDAVRTRARHYSLCPWGRDSLIKRLGKNGRTSSASHI